ncbi:tRNA (adenine(58)-N(1))-methyltransferase, mitochondrial [Kryptolebias marmoratus]|uniref:tRNA (adenine(58)-N(1))-methyltransferase n=1 Tax=Kryptolebias marmoratus TaxID=37003 RepID=A0A3Q3A7W1_KRYMA|nr:tRNA (adenine(58)-N(1))-methyltransferase, mitochondrial [Kryptolebias marmoratus]
MVLDVPFRYLLIKRLVTVCTSKQTRNRNRDIFVKLTERSYITRSFCASSVRSNENEEDSADSSRLSTKLTSRQELLSRRRRPLSPLERISSLLPEDVLSPEVMQLRKEKLQELDGDTNIQVSDSDCTHQDHGPDGVAKEDHLEPHNAEEETPASSCSEEEQVSSSLPGETLLSLGELLIAEYRKKKQLEFRKMFQLQNRARLQSSWGIIPHNELIGRPAGCFQNTSMGVPIFIRRASLEDYVLHMKRGPAITYPKDAVTMLMMMDVTEGDCVLESGSGSGAMSLFLSKAVGTKGSVLSVEVREDHYKRAVKNYNNWRTSWGLRRGQEWPDNVQFHNTDLLTASSLLAGWAFHSIALDLISPHLVLPTVLPHLHPGGVCAVYIANITQVIDLLEGVRCSALPFLCERIIEVPVRDWVVTPALKKDGQYCVVKAPNLDEHSGQTNETSDEAEQDNDYGPKFRSIPYIARPHPEQLSHTAFLVKLRKFAS